MLVFLKREFAPAEVSNVAAHAPAYAQVKPQTPNPKP